MSGPQDSLTTVEEKQPDTPPAGDGFRCGRFQVAKSVSVFDGLNIPKDIFEQTLLIFFVQVSVATDQVVDSASCQNTVLSSSSTSSSSTSSTVSSPENTLHRRHTLPSPGHDPQTAPAPPTAATNTNTTTTTAVGRFQVTSSADVKVGRFSVTPAGKEGDGDGGVTSLPVGQPPNSKNILSSDDSEPEDEAFKKEIRQLRERWDLFNSVHLFLLYLLLFPDFI